MSRALAWLQARSALLFAVAVAACFGSGLAAVLVVTIDDNHDGTPDRTVSIPLTKSQELTLKGKNGNPDQVVPVDPDQQQSAAQRADEPDDHSVDLHEDARDETPPGVSADAIQDGKEETSKLADKELKPPQPAGGAQSYSCKPAPVVNQSALNGRRVGVALHFTVSPPGSLTAIRGLFNTPSFGASSNYGFELYNGRCQQWVPESRKAWAQGTANSAYVSIEIVTSDRSRASWLATPAFKHGTLAALVRDISRRHGTPLKLVDPKGCVFTPGIVDHDRLECGNSHWDVGKNFPWDVFMKQVRQGVHTAPATHFTAYERKITSNRCALRKAHAKATGRARTVALDRARRNRTKIRREMTAISTAARRSGGYASASSRKLHRGTRRKALGSFYTGKACH